jgi:hypothetical protein
MRFNIAESLGEISAFAALTRTFLAPDGELVLANYARALQMMRDKRYFREQIWEIPIDKPLRTKVSPGSYERQNNGAHTVFGSVSSAWGIKFVDPGKKSRAVTEFDLVGLASTRVAVLDGKPEEPGNTIGVWKMEIGDAASPGCHFHVQIEGKGDYYPTTLSVPRIPSIISTPLAAAEFALGELFQEDWPKHVARTVIGADQWETIQKKRFRNLLFWSFNEVTRAGRSPWAALKSAKPPSEVFVEPLVFNPFVTGGR